MFKGHIYYLPKLVKPNTMYKKTFISSIKEFQDDGVPARNFMNLPASKLE